MAEESRVGQLLSQPNPLAGLRTTAAPWIDENLSEAAIMQILAQLLRTAPATEPTLGGVAEKMAIGLGGFVDPRMAGAATLREGLDKAQGPMGLEDMMQSGMLPLAGITLFHGSPYRFMGTEDHPLGRFLDERINTGEGTQMEGWGHYLSDNAEYVAPYGTTPEKAVRLGGQPVNIVSPPRELPPEAHDALQAFYYSNGKLSSAEGWLDYFHQNPSPLARTKSTKDKATAWLRENIGKLELDPGWRYTVDLPDEYLPQFADRYAPPSRELSRAIQREMLSSHFGPNSPYPDFRGIDPSSLRAKKEVAKAVGSHDTVGSLLDALEEEMSPPDAAALLKRAGLKGLFYDGSSANTARRNYVVFDPEILKIQDVERLR